MNNRRTFFRRLCLPAAFALAGCAGQATHQEGMVHLEQGRWEEGLQKLEEASAGDRGNLRYRADLLTERDRIVTRLLTAADTRRATAQLDEAESLYRRVIKLDPENTRAKAGLAAVEMDRRHTAAIKEGQAQFVAGDLAGARMKVHAVLLENPKHADARALAHALDERMVKYALAEPKLKTRNNRPVTLQFRDANIKMVFEALSRTTGINFILDKDIQPQLRTTIFVQQVLVDDAIDLILSQNQLAKKILSENSVFIYPNTPAKIKDHQDQIVKTFYLTNADAKQAMNMLKVMLNAKVLFVDEKSNLLVMRDTPDSVRMAEKLIASLDLPEPEVMMEVEVLEIRRSKLTQLGIRYPEQVSFSASGAVPDVLTVADLDNLNSNRVLVSPIGVTLDLRKEDADINVLASPRIRARNRERAKILIGDRVPVITNTVTPTASGTSVVTGNVQYLDVGLKLDVEPTVHLDDDVAIKVTLEVSSITREITTASGTIAYQIGTRNASTLLRLKDGETQILAGLINDSERRSAAKIPGLGDIPILGRLFSSHKDDEQKTEIVLSITPRLVRNLERPDAKVIEFWFGTEANPRTRPLTVESVVDAEPAASAPARPSGPARSPAETPTTTPQAEAATLAQPEAETTNSNAPSAPADTSMSSPAETQPRAPAQLAAEAPAVNAASPDQPFMPMSLPE